MRLMKGQMKGMKEKKVGLPRRTSKVTVSFRGVDVPIKKKGSILPEKKGPVVLSAPVGRGEIKAGVQGCPENQCRSLISERLG